MFGHSYFGSPYFGPSYWGDIASAVPSILKRVRTLLGVGL